MQYYKHTLKLTCLKSIILFQVFLHHGTVQYIFYNIYNNDILIKLFQIFFKQFKVLFLMFWLALRAHEEVEVQ